MKMNISIKNESKELEIVNIDIKNGHWKYIDDVIDVESDKIPLTINTINKSRYLSLPVKDAYPFCDFDLLKEKNEYKVVDAMVRTYDSLLDYLNCRIENAKEDYKKHGWKEHNWYITMFEDDFKHSRGGDIVGSICYEKTALLEVKIEVIE